MRLVPQHVDAHAIVAHAAQRDRPAQIQRADAIRLFRLGDQHRFQTIDRFLKSLGLLFLLCGVGPEPLHISFRTDAAGHAAFAFEHPADPGFDRPVYFQAGFFFQIKGGAFLQHKRHLRGDPVFFPQNVSAVRHLDLACLIPPLPENGRQAGIRRTVR